MGVGGCYVVCGLRYDRGIMLCVAAGSYGACDRVCVVADGREVVVLCRRLVKLREQVVVLRAPGMKCGCHAYEGRVWLCRDPVAYWNVKILLSFREVLFTLQSIYCSLKSLLVASTVSKSSHQCRKLRQHMVESSSTVP
jgi:hypothetical protein